MLTPDFTFHHTVTIRPWLRRGISANEYGPEEIHKCRVNFKRKKTYRNTQSGAAQEVVASGTVFLSAGVRVPPESEVWFGGRRYSALSCQPCYDWRGVENHVEVEIQ